MTQPISLIAKSLVRERARTGLSLAEVARRAGIAKSTLSQLESGNGNPSLETLWALCVALDIPFARLLEPQVNTTQVIRRGEGTKVIAEQANYQAILLAACPPGARRDIYLLLTHRVPWNILLSPRGGRGSASRRRRKSWERGITSAIPPIGSTFSRRWNRIPRRYWSPSRTSHGGRVDAMPVLRDTSRILPRRQGNLCR